MKSRILPVVVFGGLCALSAWGGLSTTKQTTRRIWYWRLKKPSWTPSPRVFAPVWTTLYALMTASAYRVYRAEPSADRSRALALWMVQLGLNAAWTPLFFGKRRPGVALVDLGALLATLGAYTAVAARVDKPAAYMMAPYIGWSSYAGALNGVIAARN